MPRIAIQSLASHDLFQGLPHTALTILAARAKQRQLAEGEAVFAQQASSPISLNLVVHGCVRIERRITHTAIVPIALVDPGGIVDELSFLSGLPPEAGAKAIVPTDLIVLEREDMMYVSRRSVDFCESVIRWLAGRLRESEARVSDLLSLDARARLARELLRYVDGRTHEEKVTVSIPMAQDELAARIGTRRETVNRCLKEYRDSHAITDLGRARFLLDVPELYRIAGYAVIRDN